MNDTFVTTNIVDERAGPTCPSCAVSWSAIIAGTLVAASASLTLLIFGSGVGLTTVSPWHGAGYSAAGFTAMAAIWLIVMQCIASGLGGYITGRLRKRWGNLHTDEVIFRDTAHGFLTWALATVLAAGLLASFSLAVVKGGSHMNSGRGPNMERNDIFAYDIDGLYRTTNASAPSDHDVREETARIFAADIASDDFPDTDKTYLKDLVVKRTGVSESEARARVNDAIAKARLAADKARKTAATVSVFTALSMLIGAFIACVAAALGGKRRDEY